MQIETKYIEYDKLKQIVMEHTHTTLLLLLFLCVRSNPRELIWFVHLHFHTYTHRSLERIVFYWIKIEPLLCQKYTGAVEKPILNEKWATMKF